MLDKQCLICYPHEIKICYYYTIIITYMLHYVNVSVLIKFSQKTRIFTLNIMFSIKSYVLDVY